MDVELFRKKVRPTGIKVLVQAAILGFLFGELWYFARSIGVVFNAYIESSRGQVEALVACVITLLICIAYFYSREGYSDLKRLRQSYRVDLLALVVLGLLVSVSVGGVGTSKYQEYVGKVDVLQLMLLAASPVIIALMLMLKAVIGGKKSDLETPFFISDQDIKLKKDDRLELSDRAEKFAETVLNGGATDSLVFGIDAPWGIGKSSFVNFCCEYWKRKSPSKIIIHRFEPLRYEHNADLAEKLINDLISTIQEHVFVPEIGQLFYKYSRLIKGKSTFSFLGMQFAFEPSPDTLERTLESLETLLAGLDRKIIIVIDDLDRLSWPEVTNILFAIKRSFMLPNVSYVLCYDTKNIALTDHNTGDTEKVREFLEKFVNVKISLFLDSSALANYFSTTFEQAVERNLQIDPLTLDGIKQTAKEFEKIFNSEDFHNYEEFLGDIRKLKRLINTMLLFEIEKINFPDSSFNKEDLIHLLLVYVNYPNIFRKIYNTETNGKNGFFSFVSDKILGGKLEKSPKFKDYAESLTGNQPFLLEKLFGDRAQDVESSDPAVEKANSMSRACFNGQGSSDRNLERYLNRIVKLAKPDKREYQFYVRIKDKLLEGKTLDEIFRHEEFDFAKGDFSRYQLWKVIVNSSNDLKPGQGAVVVSYILERLPDYPVLEGENVGAGTRSTLVYSLLKLLDNAAWVSDQAECRNNTNKNISEIAAWIFGEGKHAGAGVINTLAKPERGPLGLFDLMIFRLYCSADRGNSLFNLQNALSLHGDSAAPTSGRAIEIAKDEMREISQKVFQIFNEQYISSKVNIFEAIDDLTQDAMAGNYSGYVSAQIKFGNVAQDQIDQLVASKKSELKVFIVYQLGNSTISSGVGCGFYDEAGKNDEKGIATKINDYLFGQCFNPSLKQDNFERFLDYLLMNSAWNRGGDDDTDYVPNLDNFTKVLEKDRLKKYWIDHKEAILALELSSKEKDIITPNYDSNYKKNLPDVYRVLDELIG